MGTPHSSEYAIEMLHITKRFPGIIANDDITLQLRHGEIHALLGENGAGKSTLMSVLFVLYKAEEGTIKKDGKEVQINSPNDANELGIGMVHQHFKLVECFTVLDNIIMGVEPVGAMGFLQKKQAREKVIALSEKYGLQVDPDAKIEDITVGVQQRTEILKMLYRQKGRASCSSVTNLPRSWLLPIAAPYCAKASISVPWKQKTRLWRSCPP